MLFCQHPRSDPLGVILKFPMNTLLKMLACEYVARAISLPLSIAVVVCLLTGCATK